MFAPQQIARITIEGTITDNRDQLAMLKKIKDASHVKALLVFVNSPGGTTTGGESLYGALRDVAASKPVVAQFGTRRGLRRLYCRPRHRSHRRPRQHHHRLSRRSGAMARGERAPDQARRQI